MQRIIFLIASFLILLCSMAMGQEPYSIAINQSIGLPSNAVYNLFQDTKGFIWFATNEGLTKYDGYIFKTYKCNSQNSTAGSCIKEDKLGRIWYENFDGDLFYIFEDSLFPLGKTTAASYQPFGISNNSIIHLQHNSIDFYKLRNLKLTKKIKFEQNCMSVFSSIGIGNDFYFLKDQCIYHLDSNQRLKRKKITFENNSFYKQIYASKDFIIVVSRENKNKKLYYFDRQLAIQHELKIPEPNIIQGCDFIDNQFWIHSTKGTFAYSFKTPNAAPKVYLQNKSVSGMIKDRQNNYWFSTTSEGVFLTPNIQQQFINTEGFQPSKIVKTKNGLLLANRACNFLLLQANGKLNALSNTRKEQADLYYLFADSSNNDLFYSAKGTNYVPKLLFELTENSDEALKEIVRVDKHYYAYVCNGFCALKKIKHPDPNFHSPWDTLFEQNKNLDSSGNIARIGNINGRGKAIAYNMQRNSIYVSGSFGFFIITPDRVSTLKNGKEDFFASKIFVVADKLYALNTRGNLFKIDNERNFSCINTKLGIAYNEIKYARQFGNQLILYTKNFIHYVDLLSGNATIIDVAIAPANINDVYLQDSSVFILCNEGIIRSPLIFEKKEDNRTIFHINAFEANDIIQNEYQNRSFSYKQNDISIRYSLLNFGTVRPIQLFYCINDDDEWKRLPSDSRSLQFRALSSGHYSIAFRLDEKVLPQKIQFTIDAPFWYQWWFILLCIGTSAAVGFVYYRWQIGILSKQIKLLNEKVALEQSLGKSILTSIKSQMNPHFFYNALNTIQAYIFTNDKHNASLYLGKFSKLTRMILEMSEKERISISEEVKALTLYLELEKMRFDEGDFDFEITIDPNIDTDLLKIPSMLIQPYAENAIKHGLLHTKNKKKLHLAFAMQQDNLKVTIDDNGIGRKKSAELNSIKHAKHQSFSTNANQKRLEILNKHSRQKVVVSFTDKTDSHGNPLGTTVIIHIPTNTL